MVRLALATAMFLLVSLPAQGRPPEIADIFALREIGGFRSGLVVSPDASQVAVFERETLLAENDYRFRLVVVAAAGGRARVIADAGAATLRTSTGRYNGAIDDRIPIWSPDSQWIAYLASQPDGVELWRIRRDGSRRQRLVADGRDVLIAAYLNDEEIVFSSGPNRSALQMEAARQALFGFYVDERLEPYYSLRPYPNLLQGQQVRVLRLADRSVRDATATEARALGAASFRDAPADHIAFDERNNTRIWIAPVTPGDRATRPTLGLYLAQPGALPRPCAQALCGGRLQDAWLVATTQVLFQRMEGHGFGDTALYLWDTASDSIRLIRRGDEALLGCDAALEALICLHESANQPRRLVALTFADWQLHVLRDPNPQWRNITTTRVERLDVEDGFGNAGYAHLVWPHGYTPGQRYPLVIVQYRSRGFLRGGVGNEYPIHALAARGYFVLSVERTEWRDLEAQLPASELQTRTELDGSELQMKQTQLETLLDLLEQRGLIDPRRIGITGFSDGAETAYLMLINSDRIAAAVVSTPPTDPISWPLISRTFRGQQRADGVTGPWSDSPEPWSSWWRRNAISLHADRIRAPILMNFSDNEALLGFPLTTRLEELDRPFEMYIYPGEYHVKWRPQHILRTQTRALDWLDFWLRNVERSDPDEPGRLDRWRALRANQAAAAAL